MISASSFLVNPQSRKIPKVVSWSSFQRVIRSELDPLSICAIAILPKRPLVRATPERIFSRIS